MKLDKILEYQKADLELMALENEVAKSEQRQKLAAAKAKLDQATDMVVKLKQEASDLLVGFAQIKDKIDALKEELDEFDGILDDVQDETEADYYIKSVSAIADKIAALEKEANGATAKIDQVNDNYKKTWEQGVKANEAYKAAKAEYDALVKNLQPKVLEIQKQLVALKAEVPPKMMEAYQACAAQRRCLPLWNTTRTPPFADVAVWKCPTTQKRNFAMRAILQNVPTAAEYFTFPMQIDSIKHD